VLYLKTILYNKVDFQKFIGLDLMLNQHSPTNKKISDYTVIVIFDLWVHFVYISQVKFKS